MSSKEDGYAFSFSGLKTAVINEVHHREQQNLPVPVADIAASFQQAVIDVLVQKAEHLLESMPKMRTFCPVSYTHLDVYKRQPVNTTVR